MSVKILLTGDLHFNHRWFEWLEEQASSYGLICIAGDLPNAFSNLPIPDQIGPCVEHLKRLAETGWVAVCSGNHDQVQIPTPWLPMGEPL
jgi:uncharacterized protein